MSRFKKITILLLVILLSAAIYWLVAFQKTGEIQVSAGVNGYLLEVNGKIYNCEINPCVIRLPYNLYEIKWSKSGYLDEYYTVDLSSKILNWSIEPRFIPYLKVSPIIPSLPFSQIDRQIPEALASNRPNRVFWSPNGDRLVYVDSKLGRLVEWSSSGEKKIITPFGNADAVFYWSHDQNQLFAHHKNEFYFINFLKKSKQKIVTELLPAQVKWGLNGEYLLIEDEKGDLYKWNLSSQTTQKLTSEIRLSYSSLVDDSLYFIPKNDPKSLSSLSVDLGLSSVVLSDDQYQFERVVSFKGGLYLKDLSDGIWYQLEGGV